MRQHDGLAWVSGRRASVLVSCILGVGLAGCAVGPNYVAPVVPLEGFHTKVEPVTGTGAGSAVDIDVWWAGFDDPLLIEVVQRSLAQNLDLSASIARVSQARAVAAGAGALLLPTVDLQASGTAARQSLRSASGALASGFPGYGRNYQEYAIGPAASWEIDLAGGLRRNSAAALDELQAAESAGAGTRITVAADAADAYLQVRGFQARLSTAQNQIDTDERLFDLVEARFRLGASDGREVAQARALLKGARAVVPGLRTNLEAQLNRLDVLMGVQPGTYAAALSVPADIPSVPSIENSTQPIDVLRRRPDVIAAERRLAASSERIGVALADYYPKISLSGALGFDSLTTGKLFTKSAFQSSGTGSLQWRLFDFGKVDAEVAQARGANAEALADYRASVLKAVQDVENAFTALVQSRLRQTEVSEEVDALQQARALSQIAYEAGSITLTDVLDADRQLLTARDELQTARTDVARSAVATFRALGGGWSPAASNQQR